MQTPSGRTPIGELWNSIQSCLFPVLEDEIGALDEKHRQFVAVCELCAPQDHMATYRWIGNGCPPSDRLALCKAFIAKAVWDFATTRDLIDAICHRPALRRLCGWETLGQVPSEATFSRAFDAFACDGRPQQIHEALLKTHYADKLAGSPRAQSRTANPGSTHGTDGGCNKSVDLKASIVRDTRTAPASTIFTYKTPRDGRQRRTARGVLQEPAFGSEESFK